MIPEGRIRAYAERSWSQAPRFPLALPPVAGTTVLDLAGGPGVYTRALLEAGAGRVVWHDASETLRQIAISKLTAFGSRVEFRIGDMAELSVYAPGTFDGVFFRDAIHHALDEGAVLAAIARVLKPGGWLYLYFSTVHRLRAEPKRWSLLAQLPVAMGGWVLGWKLHTTLFTSRRVVRRRLRACGLSIGEERRAGNSHALLLAWKHPG